MTPAQASTRARGRPPRQSAGGPVVVKLGGRALEAPGALPQLAAEIGRLPGCVVIHGGGAEVSDWSERLGIEARFVDGLRVTDPATLEVAVAVLAGLANKRLVALLRAADLDAVGLSALDGGIVEAAPHARAAELGAVGEVAAVNPQLLATLLGQGRVPVLASIGASDGALLNLNADDLAAGIAGALGARALVLLSDTPGLVLGGEVVQRLRPDAVARLLEHPEVQGGMRPKLRAAAAAIEGGAHRVAIGAWSGPGTLTSLVAGESGTVLSAEALEASRG